MKMSGTLTRAINYIKSGNKVLGKQLLTTILKKDPQNVDAWLWMSAVVDTDDLRRECLQEVLKYDPNNQAAMRGLEKLPEKRAVPIFDDVREPPVITPMEIPPMKSGSDLIFKFRYVQGGQAKGLWGKNGAATGRKLVFGEDSLAYDEILDSTVRDNRLVLAIKPNRPLGKNLSKALIDGSIVAIEVQKIEAADLERHIDRVSSRSRAEENRQRLIDAGKGPLFLCAACPECQAIIDLSEMIRSKYIYCRFCETVFTQEHKIVTRGTQYRICNECGMFDRVRGYTEFYFYFLLVAYGFSMKRRHVCDNCANGIFRKTLLLNLIFLLGVPSSIYLKVKSLVGRDPNLKQLAKANALASKGKCAQATPIFRSMHKKYSNHPGLLMDEGMGYLFGKNLNQAMEQFEQAIDACSNYLPVLQLVHRIQNPPQNVS